MYLLRIAARNLFRRKKRTFIIASIMTLAVISFLLLESMMIAMMDMSFGNVIDFETPHIEIGRGEYFAEAEAGEILPLDETFSPDRELHQEIESLEGYTAKTGIIAFSGDFIAGRHEFPVQVRAVDPGTFSDVFRNEAFIVEGSFLEPGDEGVIIGAKLAEFFGLESGDFYTIRFRDADGSFNTIQGEVQGIVSTPHPDVNLRTVLVDKEYALSPLGIHEGEITQLMVRMENRELAVSQAEALRNALGTDELEVRSYRDAAQYIVSLETWGYIETYFILALILLVGAIGIISAVVLSAIERIKEIGMMKALGLKEGQIVRVFLFEAGGIGAIGAFIGCVIGAGLNFLFVTRGLPLGAFVDFSEIGIPLEETLYGAWNLSSFFVIFFVVLGISLAASIIPAYWAARKDPVTAIRHT